MQFFDYSTTIISKVKLFSHKSFTNPLWTFPEKTGKIDNKITWE